MSFQLRNHECSSLLRFSLRFKRSTRLLCIFCAIFSYRSFSSFAALRSLILWIWDWSLLLANPGNRGSGLYPHLTLCLLFLLEFLFMFLDSFMLLAQFGSFRIGSHARVGAEGFLVIVPVLACGEEVPKLETRQKKERKKERRKNNIIPFFFMPLTGAGAGGATVDDDMVTGQKHGQIRTAFKKIKI